MKKIIALAPALIGPAARNFKGRMLAVRGAQYVNAAILRVYGDRKEIERKEQAEIGKNFYVTRNAGRAFDAAIEEWLAKVDALCPITAYGKIPPALIPAALKTLFPYEFLQGYFKAKDQRGGDQLVASLPDSVPAGAAVAVGTYAAWRNVSLKERAGFLYFVRGLVDEDSVDSYQHEGLIFEICAAVLKGDKAFIA